MMTRYADRIWRIPLVLGSVWLGMVAMVAGAADLPSPTGPPPDPLQEQSIYIPYSKLREVFEREGRGVFLPYEEFLKLWSVAREHSVAPADPQPPLGVLIAEVDNDARVAGDTVVVQARVRLELLREGWHSVPLRLDDAAVTEASLGGHPARLLFSEQGGYRLLIEKRGTQAEQQELTLRYAKTFTRTPGQNSVSFITPQAPVSRWRFVIPEPDVKVNVEPMLACTEIPTEAQHLRDTDEPQETVALAFVGAAPTVRISWTPRTQGATGLTPLANVEVRQQVWLAENMIRTRAQLDYQISRAELTRVFLEVPSDHKVAGVFDANVRQWTVDIIENRQRIQVELHDPASQTQRLILELEKVLDAAADSSEHLPVIRAADATRQQGVVVIHVAEGLRAEVRNHPGTSQIDIAELPAALRGDATFAYRYAAVPFELTVAAEKIHPHIAAEIYTQVRLQPDELSIQALAVYQVERVGVFALDLQVPEDLDIIDVRGRDLGGGQSPSAQAAPVESFTRDPDKLEHVTVRLLRQVRGRVALELHLRKRLISQEQPGAETPPRELSLRWPRTTVAWTQRHTGRLVIYAPESLRVRPLSTQGLRDVPLAEARSGFEELTPPAGANLQAVLAYTHTEQVPILQLAVEHRKPQITARHLLVASVEPGVVKFEATLVYEVRYSGVQSLRLDVPAELAGELRNLSVPDIQESRIVPQPQDVEPGYVAWHFTGKAVLIGPIQVRLSWETRLGELPFGQSVELPVPRLRPREVDRAWGQVVLCKAENIEVRESGEPGGVQPIDPHHDLMPGAAVKDPARAFEFHDDWRLNLLITRYQLEDLKRTSIERAVVQLVQTRNNELVVRALYRVRSVQQRLEVRWPDGSTFDTAPLRINGRDGAMEKGSGGTCFIPLPAHKPHDPLLLEVRYTVPGGGSRMAIPVFPSDPAIQKIYLEVYLPGESALLGSRGPWTEEFSWNWAFWTSDPPDNRHSSTQLLAWVTEGLPPGESAISAFPTDGRPYVYSALRPVGPLRLFTVHHNWLGIWMIAALSASGIALLRLPLRGRWLATGSFVVGVVLLGMFLPTLATQVLNWRMAVALTVVGVIWLVHHGIRRRPLSMASDQAKIVAMPPALQDSSGPQDDRRPQP